MTFDFLQQFQRRIQRDFDNADAVLAPKLSRPKKYKQKNKSLLELKNLKWLKTAWSVFCSNVEVVNSRISGPFIPTMSGLGASRDTKTSDFRYKRYPLKIWMSHEFPYSLLRPSFRSKLRHWSCINNLTLLFSRPFDFAKPLDFAWRN